MIPPNGSTRTAAAAARDFLKHGVFTTPVKPLNKKPWDFDRGRLRDEWEQLRVTDAEINALFPKDANIGIILGVPSGGLVDVDLDCLEARRAASILLPRTDMIGGRESATDSHYFFVTDNPPTKASDKYHDPCITERDKSLLLELRSTGGQTVVAPSVYGPDAKKGHPEAERFVWKKHGEPSRTNTEVLRLAVQSVAAASLLGRYWPKSSRHDAALALAGGLRRAKWLEEAAVKFVSAICAAANDEEPGDRIATVRSTFAAGKDDKLTGWPTLINILGERGKAIVGAVTGWLNINPNPRVSWDTGRGSEGSPITHEPYVPIPEYRPFPTDCLPPPWDAFVREGAAALRCDEGLVAVPLLAVLAGAIGNSRRVHLGAEWYEPAVFWSCVVAESGSLKSPAAELSTDLIQARQKSLVKDFKEQVKQFKQEMQEHKQNAGEKAGDTPEEPTLRRVMAGDTTVEKLVGILDDNPRGLLVYRDELSGWVNSFTRYKGSAGGSDESNWLSTHRAGPIIYDRKTGTKTTVFVAHAAVSVTGGIQPGTLRRLMTPNFFESGLVARVMFVMPPRTPKTWTDNRITDETRAAAVRSLDDLFGLALEVDADGDPRPVVVRLSNAAGARMKQFVNQWGIRQFETEGARAAALAKLEAVPGRFALIHHTTLHAGSLDDTQPIGVESVEAGIRLAEWAALETERVYAMLSETKTEREVSQLVERVSRIAEKHGGKVTVNQLQRSYQRKYKKADDARDALNRLVAIELGEWEPAPPKTTGGWRPDYFILRKRPRVMGDSSYTRPDEGDDGDTPPGGDARPDQPRSGPDTPGSGIAEPSATATTYGENASGDSPRVYEESPITQDPSACDDDPAEWWGAEGENHHETESTITHALTTAAGVAALAEVATAWTGHVGLDTETTGLDTLRDRVRLVQIALAEDVALIDLFALPDPAATLAPLFAALAGKEIVGHNLQFDLRFLAPLGFTPGRVFDTMLASRVLHAGGRDEGSNARLRHGLEDVAERELGRSLNKDEQHSDWSGVLTPRQLAYAANDALVLVPLANMLRAKLAAANLTTTAEREMRALPGVAWAQSVTVDTTAWVVIATTAEAEQTRLAEALDAAAPNGACLPGAECRNWNSPAQVIQAFAQVGVQIKSTDDDTLAGIDHPLAGLLRDYRAVAKRVSTYGRKWVEKHVGRDGRVLPSWNQLGAESGRMSCSDPNLQQIPRGSEYRRCFVARPDCVLVKADYSQVELRIAAKVANEKVMIAAYEDGRDLHAITAAHILDKPVTEVTKADRQIAKAINFGLLYGQGAQGLMRYAKAKYDVELTDKQAQAYRNVFFKAYPGLQKWHGRVEADVKKLFRSDPDGTHSVWTLGGRRRVLSVSKRDSDGKQYPNKTDALNTPVQGTGADGLKDAIALLWERREQCPGAVPVIFCHDEIVVECAESSRDDTAAWLRACMVEAMGPLIEPVPVEVEVTVGRTWGG